MAHNLSHEGDRKIQILFLEFSDFFKLFSIIYSTLTVVFPLYSLLFSYLFLFQLNCCHSTVSVFGEADM